MSRFYHLLGVDSPFDPTHRYTTSWLLPPLVLAIIRALFSLYAFVTIFTIFGYDDSHHLSYRARQWFSYFTNLAYSGLAFYFLFSALHTFSYARKGKAWLQSWPRPLQAAHAMCYTTIVTFPFLVTIVYWGVLYTNPWFSDGEEAWTNISQHALNSFYAVVEIFLTRISPPPPLHLVFLVLLLALYLALAYLCRATEGFYVYSFLDPSTGRGHVAGYCIGILVAACVIFGIVWFVIWLRNKATKNLGKFARGQSSKRNNRSVEDGEGEVIQMRQQSEMSTGDLLTVRK